MKIFKRYKAETSSKVRQLDDLVNKEFKNVELPIGLPINQNDHLKCIYYKEFQKQNYRLFKSNPVEFWQKASKYVENKLVSYKSQNKLN